MEIPGLQKVTEVAYGFVDCKQLPVEGTVLDLCRVKTLAEKCYRLKSAIYFLLQHCSYSGG